MRMEATHSRVEWRGIAGSALLCLLFSPITDYAAQLPPPAQREINFTRDIQPIFERSCLRCHGPEKPKSGFRLDHREGLLAGGDNGKVIIPGDSTNSALIQVVAGTHEDIENAPKRQGRPPDRRRNFHIEGMDRPGRPVVGCCRCGHGCGRARSSATSLRHTRMALDRR